MSGPKHRVIQISDQRNLTRFIRLVELASAEIGISPNDATELSRTLIPLIRDAGLVLSGQVSGCWTPPQTEWGAAQLLATEFPDEIAEDFRLFLVDLMDGGICHPLCLFAEDPDDACTCSCLGQFHGHMRVPR